MKSWPTFTSAWAAPVIAPLRVSAGVCSMGFVEGNSLQNVSNHVTKHRHSKLKLENWGSREKDNAEALAENDKQLKQEHPRGETLHKDKRTYCINVVTAFLKGRSVISQERQLSWYPGRTCLLTFRQERNE